jgi:hypothetical protein
MVQLLTLPPEVRTIPSIASTTTDPIHSQILHKILSFADPKDVFRFGLSCKEALSSIDSPTLYRELFLRLFDPPSDASPTSYPYRLSLESRIRAREVIRDPTSLAVARGSPDDVEATFEALVDIAESRTEGPESKNEEFLTTYLAQWTGSMVTRPSVLDRLATRHPSQVTAGGTDATYPSAAQSAARLRLLQTPIISSLSPARLTHARETVYEQTNFLRNSGYGPFVNDASGHVDWAKLEALAVVMRVNMLENEEDWNDRGMDIPEGWATTRAREVGGSERDWAGVETQVSR